MAKGKKKGSHRMSRKSKTAKRIVNGVRIAAYGAAKAIPSAEAYGQLRSIGQDQQTAVMNTIKDNAGIRWDNNQFELSRLIGEWKYVGGVGVADAIAEFTGVTKFVRKQIRSLLG